MNIRLTMNRKESTNLNTSNYNINYFKKILGEKNKHSNTPNTPNTQNTQNTPNTPNTQNTQNYFVQNESESTKAIYNEKNKVFYYPFIYKKNPQTTDLKYLLIRFKKLQELKKNIENLSYLKKIIAFYKNIQYGFYFLQKYINKNKNNLDFQELCKLIKKKNSIFMMSPYEKQNMNKFSLSEQTPENKQVTIKELKKYTYYFDIFNDVDISPIQGRYLPTPRLPYSQERKIINIKKILDNISYILKCFYLLINKKRSDLESKCLEFLAHFKYIIDNFFDSYNKTYVKESNTNLITSQGFQGSQGSQSSQDSLANENSLIFFNNEKQRLTKSQLQHFIYPEINSNNEYNLRGGKKSLKKNIKEKTKPKSIKKSKKSTKTNK
jgi:hypothetical protein